MGKPDDPERTSHHFDDSTSLTDLKERFDGLLKAVQNKDWPYYEQAALSTTKIVSATPNRAEFEFEVIESMCNANGTLHGGCAATMMDNLTTIAALTRQREGYMESGTASRSLVCNYVRPIPLGAKARVVCEVVQAGKSLVLLKGDMRTEDGKLAVTCVHDVVIRQARL